MVLIRIEFGYKLVTNVQEYSVCIKANIFFLEHSQMDHLSLLSLSY